tara:strand:+ start:1057 stop:1194 length:138 start_codon:yes stop_codon:yes gene_type:complete
MKLLLSTFVSSLFFFSLLLLSVPTLVLESYSVRKMNDTSSSMKRE